ENHREKLCACNLPRLKDIVVPAEAGATKVGYHIIAKIIAKSCALAICRDSKTSSSRRRPGSRQKHGALCAQRPALRPTPERRRWVCSPGVGKLPGAFP